MLLICALLLAGCNQPISTQPVAEVPQQADGVEMTSEPELTAPPVGQPTVQNAPSSTLPAGPLTLVALGDSLTQGDGDDSDRSGYPGRLLEMVNATHPDSTITNYGQSGWNSDALINGDQGLESQLTRAVAELQSATSQGRGAVAFVWIGSNDLWYLYEYGEGSNENDSMDAEHFSSNIDLILDQLRSTGAQVIIAQLDDQTQRPVALKGEAFTAITQDEMARMSMQASRYNEIIAERAAQHGALVVDFFSTDIFTNPATLYDDGNHPNSVGYDVIAQKWFDVLSLIL